jgi:periplasmic divalent cation tolerance protein
LAGARFVDIWINCPDRATAERIADATIGDRLAACANVFPPISSVYRWKGAIERADEIPLLLKARARDFHAIADAVRAIHPYETPSIVATELAAVDKGYADWLAAETRDA